MLGILASASYNHRFFHMIEWMVMNENTSVSVAYMQVHHKASTTSWVNAGIVQFSGLNRFLLLLRQHVGQMCEWMEFVHASVLNQSQVLLVST